MIIKIKKPALLLIFIFVNGGFLFAQKFGYIDSQAIISRMPEYTRAQSELNKVSAQWQKEIEGMRAAAEDMRKEYEKEELLLSDDMKKERLDSIAGKDNAVREYQQKVFGFNGLIFLKRQELIQPLQDKIYDAVGKVARQKKLQVVFDKADNLVMIYTGPTHDYTDYVLEALGIGDKNDTVQK